MVLRGRCAPRGVLGDGDLFDPDSALLRYEPRGRDRPWTRWQDPASHLLHALHQYERHYNAHRPDRGINNARPLNPLPAPITQPSTITRLDIRRRDRLGGLLHEYEHAA